MCPTPELAAKVTRHFNIREVDERRIGWSTITAHEVSPVRCPLA